MNDTKEELWKKCFHWIFVSRLIKNTYNCSICYTQQLCERKPSSECEKEVDTSKIAWKICAANENRWRKIHYNNGNLEKKLSEMSIKLWHLPIYSWFSVSDFRIYSNDIDKLSKWFRKPNNKNWKPYQKNLLYKVMKVYNTHTRTSPCACI